MITALPWTLLLSVAAILPAIGAAFRLRGTTLAAPAWWAGASLAAVGGVEGLAVCGLLSEAHAGPLRYAAAVTILCPMMAVLGAKRPQDRAWQWVVVALLATLWLPAVKWLLLDSGRMELFPAWQVFLVVLVALGPLNYVPTRNWLPSLFAAGGQCLLLSSFIPLLDGAEWRWRVPAAMACFSFAGGLAWVRTLRFARRPPQSTSPQELNEAWFRFRDAFGAFWGVRVMQRVNQGLHAADLCLELSWFGWTAAPHARQHLCEESRLEQPLSAHDQAKRILRTVLRRFVRTQ